MSALLTGCVLDLLIGDPRGIPHPVVYIGRLISLLERTLYPKARTGSPKDAGIRLRRGIFLWCIVMLVTGLVTCALLAAAYKLHPITGAALEAVLTCYILAARSLSDESMRVCRALEREDLETARADLSMIVGRDTQSLDTAGVCRAAVETVAENTSDGVIAPLLYTAIGGPVTGMLYKAVNTMDSMLGYHNERYELFGRCAARMDDVFNYLPSRLSALLMICAAFLLEKVHKSPIWSAARSCRVWKKDRRAHTSPNSAQTESACAGALGVQLGGPSMYGGILVNKPFIGEAARDIEPADIRRSGYLMFMTEAAAIVLFLVLPALVLLLVLPLL